MDILRNIIATSMKIKLSIVNQDKKENHLRKLLNLGHTIGHGIEFASEGLLLHGECVSIGFNNKNKIQRSY